MSTTSGLPFYQSLSVDQLLLLSKYDYRHIYDLIERAKQAADLPITREEFQDADQSAQVRYLHALMHPDGRDIVATTAKGDRLVQYLELLENLKKSDEALGETRKLLRYNTGYATVLSEEELDRLRNASKEMRIGMEEFEKKLTKLLFM